MSRIRIIKKNDEFSPEYEIGDIFEIEGTWYGGVHISGRTGVPVSLDKEEYTELDTEPEAPKEENAENIRRDIHVGDIVRHFKREWVSAETSEYLYKVLALRSIRRPASGWSSTRRCMRRLRCAPDRTPCL